MLLKAPFDVKFPSRTSLQTEDRRSANVSGGSFVPALARRYRRNLKIFPVLIRRDDLDAFQGG